MKITGYKFDFINDKYAIIVEFDRNDKDERYEACKLYKSNSDVLILEKPDEGYYYQLTEESRKRCAKCNSLSEYYSIAPYGSKFDGEAICANCIDK